MTDVVFCAAVSRSKYLANIYDWNAIQRVDFFLTHIFLRWVAQVILHFEEQQGGVHEHLHLGVTVLGWLLLLHCIQLLLREGKDNEHTVRTSEKKGL